MLIRDVASLLLLPTRSAALRLSAPALLLLALPLAGSRQDGGLRAQAPAEKDVPSLEAPNLVEWAIAETARQQVESRRAHASKELLERSRKLLESEDPATQGEAVLVLGYSNDLEDQTRLSELARKKDSPLRERALLALGMQGGSIPSFLLDRLVQDRDETARIKAIATLARGLGEGESVGGTQVNVRAEELLQLGTRSHADEIAATLVGFSGDSGRSFLRLYHESRGSSSARNASASKADADELAVLHAAMLGSFAHIVATQKEVRILLTDFTAKGQPDLVPFRIAWGLYRNDGRSIEKRQKARLVDALLKRMQKREAEVAGMCLLAFAKHDRKRGLSLARQQLQKRSRKEALATAAFLVLGRLGTEQDAVKLESILPELATDELRAAWCLAIAQAYRRLAPAQWPLSGPIADGVEAPAPLPALRAFARSEGKPATQLQRAAAMALASLGDSASVNLLLDLHATTKLESERRQLAQALVTLSPPQVKVTGEAIAIEGIEWRLLDALAAAGHPTLWQPLLSYLDAEGLRSELRARLLRLAHIALASSSQRLGERFHAQVGPGSLPAILREVAAWQALPDPR